MSVDLMKCFKLLIPQLSDTDDHVSIHVCICTQVCLVLPCTGSSQSDKTSYIVNLHVTVMILKISLNMQKLLALSCVQLGSGVGRI